MYQFKAPSGATTVRKHEKEFPTHWNSLVAAQRWVLRILGALAQADMSADDGKVLADLPIGAGVDATKFDGDAFASCGDGTLTVARETAPEKFQVLQTVQTPRGARTMGIDPTTHTLYLPTAEFQPQSQGQSRPRPKPGSFMIVVVSPTGK
jgi:hypothetical protein